MSVIKCDYIQYYQSNYSVPVSGTLCTVGDKIHTKYNSNIISTPRRNVNRNPSMVQNDSDCDLLSASNLIPL